MDPRARRRNRFAKALQERLAEATPPWLPMPCPDNAAKLSLEEWMEYRHRCIWHREQFLDYDAGWHRPTPETAEAVWDLLGLNLADLLPPLPQSWDVTPHEQREFALTAKQALLVVLEAVVRGAWEGRTPTVNRIFDALATRWSDHFRAAREKSGASHVRDMKMETAKACRRDLLRVGLRFDKLWDAAMGPWSAKGGLNPLYYVERPPYSGYQVSLKQDSPEFAQFEQLVQSDPSFHPRDGEWRLLLRGDPLPGEQHSYPSEGGWQLLHLSPPPRPREPRRRICNEQPYNEVRLGPRSRELLDAQEKTELIFNVAAFRKDYLEARETADRIGQEIRGYGVNPALSNQPRTIYSAGKRITLDSPREQAILGLLQGQQETVRARFKQYDSARGLTENFRRVWDQIFPKHPAPGDLRAAVRWFLARGQGAVWPFDTVVKIRSGFTRIINRRYQATHCWPMYVSSKRSPWGKDEEEDWKEDMESEQAIHDARTLRRRWFTLGDNTLELVGVDVSSSVTQILAALLDLKDLAQISSEKSFNVYLAETAWERHFDKADPFTLQDGYEGVKGYENEKDERLKELVKSLWMRVLYGSRVRDVVWDQRKDRPTYGPGWTVENAIRFLQDVPCYEKVSDFLDACRRLAYVAYREDKCRGVIFTDPFDGAEVRWNPVQRDEVRLSSGRQKLQLLLSLPGKYLDKERKHFQPANPNADGDYPVHYRRLRNMVAPCLVHMLDATLSSLVLKEVIAETRDVVGIHDAWLILTPGAADPKDTVYFVHQYLEDAIRKASKEWFECLGPVYEQLAYYLDYLDPDREFGQRVQEWRAAWEANMLDGWRPHFRVS